MFREIPEYSRFVATLCLFHVFVEMVLFTKEKTILLHFKGKINVTLEDSY